MSKKGFFWRAAVLTAAAVFAVPLAACGNGKPVKSYIPEINNNPADTQAPVPSSAVSTQPETVAGDGAQGLVTQDGKTYYYRDGQLQTNGIVGDEAAGYFYANEQGEIDMNYCDGVTVDDKNWCVIEGKASPAESESDQVLFHACKTVAKYCNSSMSRDEKLRACFDGLKNDYLEGVRHDPPYQEMDWPVLYANDIFIYGKGDCFSYGAAFAYIGKAIGCSECYACNSGGHGWAEIDGKYYDPEWDMHHTEYNHFGVLPSDPCDVDYSGGLTEGVEWMRVRL